MRARLSKQAGVGEPSGVDGADCTRIDPAVADLRFCSTVRTIDRKHWIVEEKRDILRERPRLHLSAKT